MENYKKIEIEMIGNKLQDTCADYFERWYSNDINDYEWNEEIVEEYDNAEMIKMTTEVTETGKVPLLFDFYKKVIFDDNDMIIDEKYYI